MPQGRTSTTFMMEPTDGGRDEPTRMEKTILAVLRRGTKRLSG